MIFNNEHNSFPKLNVKTLVKDKTLVKAYVTLLGVEFDKGRKQKMQKRLIYKMIK